ncbi:MAG: hypothetical protein Q4E18_15415 [Clostridia bacterium]|nr:hypothetical protein [Clostridia bacterium]
MQEQEHRVRDVPDCPNALIIPQQLEIVKIKTVVERLLRQHRTNEVVGRRMDFSSDANANSEGLLEVNRGICMPQMAKKTSPDAPPNWAVVP